MLFCRNAKSAPRSHGLYRIIVVVGVISACSDGDSVNDADASRDASPHASIDASAVRDASADDKDASTVRDAGADGNDASADAGLATDAAADSGSFECKSEHFPLWGMDSESVTSATRVPLDLYCQGIQCPQNLNDFLKIFTCAELDDAGIASLDPRNDGGVELTDAWLRSDGCGSVQFSTLPFSWPRHFNFDAQSGVLIGAARLDDIGTSVPGTPCNAAGYVAGTFRASCASEVLMVCTYR
jgi:hypothetical protein